MTLPYSLQNDFFTLHLHPDPLLPYPDVLWAYTIRPSGRTIFISPPLFEVDEDEIPSQVEKWQAVGEPRHLPNGCTEYIIEGPVQTHPDLFLSLTFRIAPDNPVLRFRYTFKSLHDHHLSKSSGADRITYASLDLSDFPGLKEISFSRFSRLLHSYVLTESDIPPNSFENNLEYMGPMLLATNAHQAALLAYEHGSQVPDAFLKFHLSPPRKVDLKAARGNYPSGHCLVQPYQTVWFQMGAIDGSEEQLASHYRQFILNRFAVNNASRRPYIYYNTWAFQERNKHWNKQDYLTSMNLEHTLAEIDIAHRMGIDVFVIDTGWYIKTGDWQVNLERFPDGLKTVKVRLDSYGMKLGLWFDPRAAALSSGIAARNQDCLLIYNGKPIDPWQVWQTEESRRYCLVSRYRHDFVQQMIRLNRELGVTYFKWDALETYHWGEAGLLGCDAPSHEHGTVDHSSQERSDCYAYQFPLVLVDMVEELTEACPDAIVDFDITEGGRAVGLAFLSVAKYFLINNGPYYHDYNIPIPPDGNWNMLFYPGPARTWFCRSALSYDKWIPSVLFMTHYLSDGPKEDQLVNIGSLILGQNGIWGDLLSISADGIDRFAGMLSAYKQVRDDITSSTLTTFGEVSTSPEIYEKINPTNGRGVVVIFNGVPVTVHHVTTQKVSPEFIASEGLQVSLSENGRAILELVISRGYSCGIVFFGAKNL